MTIAPSVLLAHPSADVYGSDLQLLESLSAFEDAGWRATVVLPATGPLVDLLGEGRAGRTRFVRFSVLRKALLSARGIAALVASFPVELVRLLLLLRRVRPDLVYVNTVTIPVWIAAARLSRIPVLAHVHEAEDAAPRAIRAALAAPLLRATTVVANSVASRTALGAAIPALRRRTMVLHNGVADAGAQPRALAQPGRLALVARLSPRKGIDVALEAVAQLRRAGSAVELDIAGTCFAGYEWYEAELRRRAAQPDLQGAVHFLGYVDSAASSVLARASAVLVPSRVEPFGNTAVQAMLAQRPLIASAVQGLAEIVEDEVTGLLVAPGDTAALADAIARVLADPDFAWAMAERGRTDAVQRFAQQRYRTELVRLATRALGGHRG